MRNLQTVCNRHHLLVGESQFRIFEINIFKRKFGENQATVPKFLIFCGGKDSINYFCINVYEELIAYSHCFGLEYHDFNLRSKQIEAIFMVFMIIY